MSFRHRILPLIVALGTSVLVACAPAGSELNPAGTAPDTSPVRSASEQRQGDELHEKILARFGGAYEDRRVRSYVNGIGEKVAAVSEQPRERWTFTVLDTADVNAFAVPGGYVYVTRGLLALAENEAQVAGVIGHEIGHVTAGHGASRQSRSTVAGIGLLLGAIGLSTLGVADPALAQGALELGQAVAGGIVASYSRQDELEADYLGIRYLARAGYDPYAQAEFLDALSSSAALDAREAGRRYDPNNVSFLASHPATGPRTRQAIALAEREGAVSRGGELGVDRHLAAINGMTFGQSPDQGFVEETRFSHPKLGFTFTAPRGWRLTNGTTAVVAQGGQGERLIFDGGNDPGGSLESYITDRWVPGLARQARTGRLGGLTSFTVNGLPAARGILPVEIEGQRLDVLLVALRYRDKLYRFTGLARPGATSLNAMLEAASSFRALSAAESAELKGRRIEIVTVRRGDTVESLGRRMQGETLPIERFRVLNGLDAGGELAAGQKVKIVR